MNNNKNSILFVEPWIPFPLISGGHQAIYNGIRSMVDKYNIYVTYIGHHTSEEDNDLVEFKNALDNKAIICPYYEPISIPSKPTILARIGKIKNSIKKRIKNFLRIKDYVPAPSPIYTLWEHELENKPTSFANHILDIIYSKNIDIVQCEMLFTINIGLVIPSNVKSVFVHHEIGFVRHLLESNNENYDNIVRKLYLDSYRLNEISLLNQYNAIITLSQIDKEKLENAGVKTKIYTSFASINRTGVTHIKSDDYLTLSFVGPEFHSPNAIAIDWFLTNCWDKLQAINPSYTLKIIGNWNQSTIEKINQRYSNITFCGYVEDLTSAITNTILIVPLNVGSGIRMKILEAAIIGIPIISTTIGVEGIPFEKNKHFCSADTPNEFIDAILSLSDKAFRISLINNAYQLIQKSYSINALSENRYRIYRDILNQNS